jgi:hypothetical protein
MDDNFGLWTRQEGQRVVVQILLLKLNIWLNFLWSSRKTELAALPFSTLSSSISETGTPLGGSLYEVSSLSGWQAIVNKHERR